MLHLVMVAHPAASSDSALRDMLSQKPHLVHVGKTGGGTLRSALGALCACTPLQVHCEPVRQTRVSSPFLVSVRDPVERVISSFNWRHPRRGGGRPCPVQTICSSCVDETALYNCFATVNDFAESLRQSNGCGNVARKALAEGVGHVGKGFKYYFQGVEHLLPNMTFKLVSTASFHKDLRCALHWLKFPAEIVDALQYEVRHSEYPNKNETFLSPQGRRNLESLLRVDYSVLRELYKYADREC